MSLRRFLLVFAAVLAIASPGVAESKLQFRLTGNQMSSNLTNRTGNVYGLDGKFAISPRFGVQVGVDSFDTTFGTVTTGQVHLNFTPHPLTDFAVFAGRQTFFNLNYDTVGIEGIWRLEATRLEGRVARMTVATAQVNTANLDISHRLAGAWGLQGGMRLWTGANTSFTRFTMVHAGVNYRITNSASVFAELGASSVDSSMGQHIMLGLVVNLGRDGDFFNWTTPVFIASVMGM